MLKVRAIALVLGALFLMGSSVALGALLSTDLTSGAMTGLQIVFVLGLGAILGAGVSVMRLAGANEQAGAAARLREGRVALRSASVGQTDAHTMLHLVFADGHRADLALTRDDAGVLLPLVEACVERSRASAYR